MTIFDDVVLMASAWVGVMSVLMAVSDPSPDTRLGAAFVAGGCAALVVLVLTLA